MPTWGVRILWNREYFQRCAIGIQDGHSAKYYLILYCLQYPYHIGLTAMRPVCIVGDDPASSSAPSSECFQVAASKN
eukprot:10068751-Karenia_brevis.AAC.1